MRLSVSQSTLDTSRSASVVVAVESDVTRICGSRTALQTGRHELRRPVDLVADCDERRCLDEEVADPERVSGDRGLQTADLRDSVDCSASELSAAGCSKHTCASFTRHVSLTVVWPICTTSSDCSPTLLKVTFSCNKNRFVRSVYSVDVTLRTAPPFSVPRSVLRNTYSKTVFDSLGAVRGFPIWEL